ncbi:unnamed protein product [Trifolium pratense]|uniref:Uncharacterized protein n=1 Tax=Trifolium pratense TaxID=57577 RepID=A0ACB0KAM2_TRIPR|nr:unnamed protein product [Trifolium pratense]
MAQILKFFYILIISLSLFLVGISRTRIPCEYDDDCPEHFLPPVMTCVAGYCVYEKDCLNGGEGLKEQVGLKMKIMGYEVEDGN